MDFRRISGTEDMDFRKIVGTEDAYFTKAKNLYESAFPADERREWDDELFQNDEYILHAIHEDNMFVGLLASWTLSGYIFLEHLAVEENLRNEGRGSAILKQLIDNSENIFVGEIEKPGDTPFAARRMGFYRRNGFTVNPYVYIQPPYSEDKNPVPLFLISSGGMLGASEFMRVKESMYETAYGVEPTWTPDTQE